jgi:phosphoglycolate phosphatase
MNAPLRLVIFDLDGTIVDSQANIVRAVKAVAAALDVPEPALSEIPLVIGLSLDEALLRLFPNIDSDTHQQMDTTYRKLFMQLRSSPDYSEPLFPGTLEALDALTQEGFLLGIATGKAQRGVDYLLKRHGLGGRFVTSQTPDTAPGKPHPGMVLNALKETGVDAKNAVMIGDTAFDIQMAQAANVSSIGVSWGNHPPDELVQAGAHRMIDHLDDLLHAVQGLMLTTTAAVPAANSPAEKLQ